MVLLLLFIQPLCKAAETCPWERLSGLEMTRFDNINSNNSMLTKKQVLEDLACLKILLQNKYVAQDDFPNINLISRLEILEQSATDQDSSQLVDSLFNLHQGIPDVHLSYRVNNIVKKYSTSIGQQVNLKESLDTEKIYNREKYIYFKPDKILMPEMSLAQKEFIQLIKTEDKNLIIDLTETRGGGGDFPKELASALFTSQQIIPKTKRLQIISGLVYIGLSLTGLLVFGEQGKDTYNSIKEYVKDKKFSELVPFTVEEKIQEFRGSRPIAYKSKIYLLIDQDCGSECETIVEKLTALPNVTTVGSNTRGALHYSNALTFVLPNSGIYASIPSLRESYENDAPEGVGYTPQIKTNFIDLDQLVF